MSPEYMLHGQSVTAHEFTIWQTLLVVSPAGSGQTTEVTALARLVKLTEEEVLVALGGLLTLGLIKRMGGKGRQWFVALPDPSRPS
jgi:ABC-type multidrug transport system fused ATPase/permease subunit